LGPRRPEVEYYDEDIFDTAEQPDEPSASKHEDESDKEIRNAPAHINPSGPGSSHRTNKEPWAPLITPMQQFAPIIPTGCGTSTIHQQQPSFMGTIAVTTTTTNPIMLTTTALAAATGAPPASHAITQADRDRINATLNTAL
jgi:hypothetical protein